MISIFVGYHKYRRHHDPTGTSSTRASSLEASVEQAFCFVAHLAPRPQQWGVFKGHKGGEFSKAISGEFFKAIDSVSTPGSIYG
jgi:hypothetical protein